MKNGRKAGSRWLRQLDYAVGIPLLRLLSFVRRRGDLPETIRRIVLIKADGMGDLVLLTGVLRDLRLAYPQADIVMCGGGSIASLAAEMRDIDTLLPGNFTRPWEIIRKLRNLKADIIINCGQWSRCEALVAGLGNARLTIGFETPGQYQHALYDVAVPHRNDRHELENFRSLLHPLGVTSNSTPHMEPLGRPQTQRRQIIFHLWPSGVTHVALKRWPENAWVELARRCLEAGYEVTLTGGRQDFAENERWMAAQKFPEMVRNLAGCPMRETLDCLENAAAVVSVNTGVMHLAAALGVPTVGLHGPTNAHRWGPVGPVTAICEVAPPDGGYLNLGFEYPSDAWKRPGMDTIGVEEVWGKLRAILSPANSQARFAEV
ncbi:MAG: glycosyltransferase family 9 protein [Chthoniobacterales bacterium]